MFFSAITFLATDASAGKPAVVISYLYYILFNLLGAEFFYPTIDHRGVKTEDECRDCRYYADVQGVGKIDHNYWLKIKIVLANQSI